MALEPGEEGLRLGGEGGWLAAPQIELSAVPLVQEAAGVDGYQQEQSEDQDALQQEAALQCLLRCRVISFIQMKKALISAK